MKKIVNLIIVFTTLLTLISCGNNSENLLGGSGSITLDGKAFPIIKGSIIGVSLGDEGHAGISLVSGSTTQIKTLTIDIPTFTKETIANTYSFPKKEGELILNQFLTNYAFFEKDGGASTNLEKGTVTLKSNGGTNYTVTMDLTMKDGKVFKGSYTGDFKVLFNNG